jgi:hypothetical protein
LESSINSVNLYDHPTAGPELLPAPSSSGYWARVFGPARRAPTLFLHSGLRATGICRSERFVSRPAPRLFTCYSPCTIPFTTCTLSSPENSVVIVGIQPGTRPAVYVHVHVLVQYASVRHCRVPLVSKGHSSGSAAPAARVSAFHLLHALRNSTTVP